MLYTKYLELWSLRCCVYFLAEFPCFCFSVLACLLIYLKPLFPLHDVGSISRKVRSYLLNYVEELELVGVDTLTSRIISREIFPGASISGPLKRLCFALLCFLLWVRVFFKARELFWAEPELKVLLCLRSWFNLAPLGGYLVVHSFYPPSTKD